MSTTSEEGGGASSGSEPLIITVPVNIPLPEWWKSSCQVGKILLSVAKLRNCHSAKRPRKPGQK